MNYRPNLLFRPVLWIAFIACFLKAGAQGTNNDSLLRIFNNSSAHDTVRANALKKMAENYAANNPDSTILLAEKLAVFAGAKNMQSRVADAYLLISLSHSTIGDNDSALSYAKKALVIREKTGDKKGMARCYTNIGLTYSKESNFDGAMEAYQKAIKLSLEANDKKSLAKCYNNIGVLYNNQANYPLAMNYYMKALKVNQENDDKTLMQGNYANLAEVYFNMGNFLKTEECYRLVMKIAVKTGDKIYLGRSYSGLGILFKERQMPDTALKYLLHAATLFEEVGYLYGMSSCYTTLGLMSMDLNDFPKALDYSFKALDLKMKIDDKLGVSTCYVNLAGLYRKMANNSLSVEYARKAISQSKEIDDIDGERLAYQLLSDLYATDGNYKAAYENQLLFKQLNDSIFNMENSRQMGELKTKFEVEKKEMELEEKARSEKIHTEARSEKEKMQRYALSIVLVLTAIFGVFIFKRFKVTQKQKQIIELKNKETEQQKALIEEHQKETIDSINYAQRIQFALLANSQVIVNNLPRHFVFFKPKAIVSGDFYWAAEHEGKFYLAVCDSTGHGVPGAFMSLLNISFLNEAINEKKITKPNEILDHVRNRLVETISQDGGKDGMDATLICYDPGSGSLTYAAANNAPIIISNNSLRYLAFDKMPVGKGERETPFQLFTAEHQPGDMIYLFTDGYPDQFGGPLGKKFKYRQLEELLLSAAPMPPQEQKELIGNRFAAWKGQLQQVDDVCIIGFRI